MEIVSIYVFLPIMLTLMIVAGNERQRQRVLSFGPVSVLEKRLNGFHRLYGLAFGLCMAAGVFVRCWRFLELPGGVNQDGMMAGVEAFCLASNGTDQFGMSWPTYFQAWGFAQMSTLYSWLMIPFVKLMGINLLSLRLPMLLASLVSLVVMWDFARRLFGKHYALLVLFIAVINPWHILQSRWALEANLFPHVMLLGAYLLFIGKDCRWALYLSMLILGLTPYAYGVACFSVPLLLLGTAIFYVARRKVGVLDVFVCVVLFVMVSGPYFYTMAINSLGLEQVTLGPITLPMFEMSQRTNDMPFFRYNPYETMLLNLQQHFSSYLYGKQALYNAVGWAHTMYRFMPPVLLLGLYKIWRDRRAWMRADGKHAACDGAMIVLLWYGVALFGGMCVGGVINRNNAVFYPLMFFCAYGLYWLGKRMRVALACAIVLLMTGFAALNVTYFTDEEYQKQVAADFHDGLVDALSDTWGWDYDEVVISVDGSITSNLRAQSAVMFAHQIDYSGRSEEVELLNVQGEPTGWYFTERYQFVNMEKYELDPMACSVYIVPQAQRDYFSPEEYLLTDYSNYVAAYPRYWAE